MREMQRVMRLSVAGAALLACAGLAVAQMPGAAEQAAQKEAMQKLAFLAGHWSGPITVQMGPGEPLHLTQTETVEYKLDGLVLLIEGKSTDAAGKVEFEALATIAYDDQTHSYRIRAYHAGHYVDTDLTAHADGFAWGFAAGAAQVENTMHLTSDGQWKEETQVTVPNRPAFQAVEMTLTRQK
ncbi:MAG: DUF1579 family protein [Terracidiphilus sp.]